MTWLALSIRTKGHVDLGDPVMFPVVSPSDKTAASHSNHPSSAHRRAASCLALGGSSLNAAWIKEDLGGLNGAVNLVSGVNMEAMGCWFPLKILLEMLFYEPPG